jgi:hypothetical protein
MKKEGAYDSCNYQIKVKGCPLRALTHNETPDGVSGTKGAYDAEVAGSQIPIVQVKGDQ